MFRYFPQDTTCQFTGFHVHFAKRCFEKMFSYNQGYRGKGYTLFYSYKKLIERVRAKIS